MIFEIYPILCSYYGQTKMDRFKICDHIHTQHSGDIRFELLFNTSLNHEFSFFPPPKTLLFLCTRF